MTTDSPLRLAPRSRDVSLYVHIPFCRSKCRYCDFYSIPDAGRGTMEDLVRAEIAEIDRFAAELELESPDTVFIGGGTPSLLPVDLLAKLLARIGNAWTPVEWTVEANPESLSGDFVAACADAGVTRLSLGVQSFDDRLLALLGRAGTADHVRRALDLLASSWTGDLSLDLISGIPTQTVAGALRDLERAAACAPGHLSLYALTLEEGTPLFEAARSGELVPPGEDEEVGLWRASNELLAASGYRRYEVSNFARPGKECRHNLRYWRLDPYVGVGPGAASTLAGADGEVLRLEAPRDVRRYSASAPLASLAREELSPGTVLLEQLMMGLRLEEGIERARIRRRFGLSLEECLGGSWEEWIERGLVRPDEEFYACTDEGRLLLNALLREAAGKIAERRDLSVSWP